VGFDSYKRRGREISGTVALWIELDGMANGIAGFRILDRQVLFVIMSNDNNGNNDNNYRWITRDLLLMDPDIVPPVQPDLSTCTHTRNNNGAVPLDTLKRQIV